MYFQNMYLHYRIVFIVRIFVSNTYFKLKNRTFKMFTSVTGKYMYRNVSKLFSNCIIETFFKTLSVFYFFFGKYEVFPDASELILSGNS